MSVCKKEMATKYYVRIGKEKPGTTLDTITLFHGDLAKIKDEETFQNIIKELRDVLKKLSDNIAVEAAVTTEV